MSWQTGTAPVKRKEILTKPLAVSFKADASKQAGEVSKKVNVLMDYLTGHIGRAWLLAGCSAACSSLRVSAKCRAVTAGTPDHLIGLEQSVGSVLKANWVMVVRVLVRVRYDNDWKRSMTRSGGVTSQIKIKSVS